jgi:hypothetical protein
VVTTTNKYPSTNKSAQYLTPPDIDVLQACEDPLSSLSSETYARKESCKVVGSREGIGGNVCADGSQCEGEGSKEGRSSAVPVIYEAGTI